MANACAPILTPLEKETRMVGAWMVSKVFAGVDFSDTIFEKARCENTAFVAVDLRRADFRGAFLGSALFLHCDLRGARFPGAHLARARFIACAGLEPEAAHALRARGAEVSERVERR